jgi:succinoglycan biosynthesis protein ExoM
MNKGCLTEIGPRISICIITFKRPESLKRLLTSIFESNDIDSSLIEIVVVDNDCTRSAEAIVKEFQLTSGWKTTYAVEPKQNIARARNKSIALASGEYCAMIDDDEYVSRKWLSSHLQSVNVSHIAGSFGPVLPRFEVSPPKWLVEGRFFERTRSDGQEFPFIAGNAFIKRSVFLGDMYFREDFGLSGGEDTELFLRMKSAGLHFEWHDSAVVWEVIPPERMAFGYILKRAYRGGQTYVRILLQSNRTMAFSQITKGAGQCVFYALAMLVLFFGRPSLARIMAARCAVALGKVSAILGLRFEEYK